MAVRFGSPDLLPHLSAFYTCGRCGRFAARHGRDAGRLPSGWVTARGRSPVDHVCRECLDETPRERDR